MKVKLIEAYSSRLREAISRDRPDSLSDDRYFHFSSDQNPPKYRDEWSTSMHAGTPYGLYCYQGWAWDDPKVSFAADRKHVFVLEKTGGSVLDLQKVSESDISKLLSLIESSQVDRLTKMYDKYSSKFNGNHNGVKFWYYLTKTYPHDWSKEDHEEMAMWSAPGIHDPKLSNRILRNMGISVVEDVEGIIWPSEPIQSFFTSEESFRILEKQSI